LHADVKHLISRVVVGRGAFDYWESGLDIGFGPNMYDSFVKYQSRLIKVFDSLAVPYGFEVIDATRPPVEVFETLKASSRDLRAPAKPEAPVRLRRLVGRVSRPAPALSPAFPMS
jgi:dTMP kinase